MPGLVHFLRCVTRAAVHNGGRALASLVPLGEVGFEIARDAYEEYRRRHGEPQLQARLQDLARVPRDEFRRAAEEAAVREAARQPAEVQLALVSFLGQLPAPALPLSLLDPAADGPVAIHGPQRTYTLLGRLAAGDIADIHLGATDDRPAPAPQPRYTLKVSRGPAGNPLLDNERQILAHLLVEAGDSTYRHYLPALVESFIADDSPARRVNVFAFEPQWHTLEQVRGQHLALDGPHLAWVFNRLLTVLGFCHRSGILHAAVLPCHVLVHAADHGLQLIGWGQSVATGKPVRHLAARYRQWYPPEVHEGRRASAATDLFGVARCMVYLAGGDPACDRLPDTLPAPMRRFFAGCLLKGQKMRPGDAWALLDEFNELLQRLYGPPKFHPLTLT
jgi:hypothetical protein